MMATWIKAVEVMRGFVFHPLPPKHTHTHTELMNLAVHGWG